MLFGLIVFGVIVAILFSFVATYNKLVAAAEKATRAWNDLDALLRQWHDEIPKLVETCAPHLRGEHASFEQLLEARSAVFAARQTRDADALGGAERRLRVLVTGLLTRAAAHAELTASPAFALLRQRHATLDTEIAERRDRYNEAAREYNAARGRAPGRIVALTGEFPALRPLETSSP
jgi:LemA protein